MQVVGGGLLYCIAFHVTSFDIHIRKIMFHSIDIVVRLYHSIPLAYTHIIVGKGGHTQGQGRETEEEGHFSVQQQ